jgi:hypothetical protein
VSSFRRFSVLVICSSLILIQACKDQKKESDMEPADSSLPKQYSEGNYYFGSALPSGIDSSKYNTELLKFKLDSLNGVTGEFYVQPYGSDGAKGSFSGTLDQKSQKMTVMRRYYAEGEIYRDTVAFQLNDASLALGYANETANENALPRIDSTRYTAMMRRFQQGYLTNWTNTTDRTRLKKLSYLKENGFSERDMDSLKFMEVMIDLNNDPSELEYLIYVMGPMLCGTGGCNLFVMRANGELISNISVSRPPIYVPITSIAQQQAEKSQWKDVYVYSKGMRRLSFDAGAYTSNASMGSLVQDSTLTASPEAYLLVMDYLE